MFEPCPDGPARQVHNRLVDLIIGCPMMAVFRKIDRAAVFLTGFVIHHGDFTASIAASCNRVNCYLALIPASFPSCHDHGGPRLG